MTYETPELFEIGGVEEMTHGWRWGNEPDTDLIDPTKQKRITTFADELVGEEAR